MYDVIVIGGGPGGSSVAGRAASRGLKVLLLEKQVFPRPKPCGGAVSEQALSYLGGSIPDSLIEKEIFGARIRYGDKAVEDRPGRRLAVLVDRGAFDHYLLEEARALGAEIRFEGVRDLIEEEGGVRALTREGVEYQGKFGVIAEGAHGNLKYKVRKKEPKEPEGLCLSARIVKEEGERARFEEDLIEIHFGVVTMGYGWVFPHKNHYSVGVGGLSSRMKESKQIFTDFLHRKGFPKPGPVRGHRVPLRWHTKRLAEKRILLCGDAGGFVDTFFGEGIAYAIRSGQLAAECIASSLQAGGPAPSRAYIQSCRAEFAENLKYSYILARLIAGFPSLFFTLLVNRDKYVKKFLQIPLQETTYKKLLPYLLANFLLDLPHLFLARTIPVKDPPAKAGKGV